MRVESSNAWWEVRSYVANILPTVPPPDQAVERHTQLCYFLSSRVASSSNPSAHHLPQVFSSFSHFYLLLSLKAKVPPSMEASTSQVTSDDVSICVKTG